MNISATEIDENGVDAAGGQTESWAFKIGDMVTHHDQIMPSSLVLWRTRCGNGWELYGVRSFAFQDEQRDRMVLGQALRPIDEAAWADCLLYNTGLVPEPVFA
jgi:hypothetical protein